MTDAQLPDETDKSASGAEQCEARDMDGSQCEHPATQYIDFSHHIGRDSVETRVYCESHADDFAEKAFASVLGRGRYTEVQDHE